MTDAAKLFSEIAQPWVAEPAKLVEAQGALFGNYMQLVASTAQRAMGGQALPVAEPEAGDNRFNDPEWSRNPYFDFWKQSYLITMRWLEDLLDKTEGLDERTRQRAEFYLKQLVSALSPSNFPLTNPVVLRETFQSSGQNLVQGMANLVHDLERSGDLLNISQTDVEAFEVGRNVATAPGKVVFQNDIIQLIQYAPSTESVYERPLLIVPPWINKFYILDLGPQKSFIRFAVSKGFTVFVVSWVNPDAAPRAQDLRGLHERGHPGGDGRGQARDGRRQDQRDRLLRRRHAARAPRLPIWPRAARSRSRPPPSSPPRSTSPRPATSCCSSMTPSSNRSKR